MTRSWQLLPKRPNTFIVGAPKCGTTSLFHYLREHPQVFLPEIKEPKYWSPDLPNPLFRDKSLEEYLDLFQGAGSDHLVIGEASTTYLASKSALQEIIEFFPESKFVALVRDPLSFLLAYHSEQCMTFHEDEQDFERAWRLQAARRRGEQIPRGCIGPLRLDYEWAASFGQQVSRMVSLIPESQRRVIVFEDFVREPGRCYDALLEFLNVRPHQRANFEHFHARRRHRFQAFRRLWIRPPPLLSGVVLPLRRVLGAGGLNLSRHVDKLLTRRVERPVLSPEFREELCRVFAEDVKLLESLLKRRLDGWLDCQSPVC